MRAEDLQRLVDASPVHRELRLAVADVSDTAITLTAEPGRTHTGGDGSQFLHGGVVATMLDTAATFALIQATGTDWSTVDLRIDFLRPAPSRPLLAVGTAVQIGRRLGRATAELSDPSSGRMLASAVGTFARTAPGPEAESGS